MSSQLDTVWVLGDQLNRRLGAMAAASPKTHRVLMVESRSLIEGRNYHRQRLHFVLTAMRRFARELEGRGFEVDYRRSTSLAEGLTEHRSEHSPAEVLATEPNSIGMRDLIASLEVEPVRSNQFLCHHSEFAEWAGDRRRLRMEDFYRWQRSRLGYLMDGHSPAEGRWNYDRENREPPPEKTPWPTPQKSALDDLDHQVLSELPSQGRGSEPVGWWATSRRAALSRLSHFIEEVLPYFGPHEDAMLTDDWHMAHSLLSPYLNIGLLLPGEVCDRVEKAYREGRIPINSAEGMIRQVVGWREFVWGVYWLWPHQADSNVLEHKRPLPPAWTGDARTSMNCLSVTLDGLEDRAWVHHIQRLMILSNFANLYGMDPLLVRDWMRERYIDGANWVMVPNVMGMGLWADGGKMSTKPYVSGGAYVNRMSDYCSDCVFDPAERAGKDACPFTTLYWDFLDRHRDKFASNARLARQYANLDRLSDISAVKARARSVITSVEQGRI